MVRARCLAAVGVLTVSTVLASLWIVRRGEPVRRQGPPPVVPCVVTIADPASGLATVRLEFSAEAVDGRSQLLLAFADARNGAAMPRSFAAVEDGRPVLVASDSFRGGLLQRVPVSRGAGRVVVTYTINPTFFPPGGDVSQPADARSRITADLAIVRSTSLLPVIGVPGIVLGVSFTLPPGWIAVTPWREDHGRVLAPADASATTEYLALGPFETRDFAVGAAVVRVAAPAAFGKSFPVEVILAREIELVGAPLKRAGLFTATVVPDAFMRGGAAGERTIVQSSSPEVLAHEVFHWWNDSTLTARDASWFREGLTEYYGIKVAREAQVWTPEAEAACLADLNGEMRFLERGGARSLVDVSMDPQTSRLVYSKGALFWLLADRRLQAAGRFLEEAVRRVVTSDRHGLTTPELRALFSGMYGGLLDEAFDRYVTGAEALPDLDLGPATGRSGCARDLPPR